jgi:hypothetical protein
MDLSGAEEKGGLVHSNMSTYMDFLLPELVLVLHFDSG